MVAIDRNSGQMLAVGEEARVMLGRTPGNIVAVRPLQGRRYFQLPRHRTDARFFLRKVMGKKLFFKPRVVVCVPSGVTEVEKAFGDRSHGRRGGKAHPSH